MASKMRRTLCRILVRDLCRATRRIPVKTPPQQRVFDVQVPCVEEYWGLYSTDKNMLWEGEWLYLPPLLRDMCVRTDNQQITIDWDKFRTDVMQVLWCEGENAAPPEKVKRVEDECFKTISFLSTQRRLRQNNASEVTTDKIKVSAMTGEIKHTESDKHQFIYRITVENLNPGKSYRILYRNLKFYRETGVLETEVKQGLGVVGFSPLLHPGDVFSYHSGVYLASKSGRMDGTLELIEEDESSWEKLKASQRVDDPNVPMRTDASIYNLLKDTAVGSITVPLPKIEFHAGTPTLNLREPMFPDRVDAPTTAASS